MSIVSESSIETLDGIPVVIVYNENETYATQGGINYDKLTYELLLDEEKANKFTVTKTKPVGPVDRLLTDVLGMAIIYAGTFILCDLFRTFKKGRWTSLAWMFLGPWNAITGAPLLHKITKVFDSVDSKSYAVSRCQSKYETAQRECAIPFQSGYGTHDECTYNAEVDYQVCMENTPDFQQCERQAEDSTDAYGHGTYCDEQGDDNPTCYGVNTSSDFYETQDCLRAVGYDGTYYGV